MDHPASPLPAMSVEQRYRLLVEAVTDYAIYLLDATGHVSSWNAGAQRFKGYAESEILGSHFSRFYVDEDRQNGLPARTLDTAAREGRFEGEGWRQRKDGTRFWAHVVVDSIRDAQGQLLGFAKVTRDLTERRETQQALERARESLLQAQKVEAIGQLTGGVAHDFNNLLMVIVSSMELIRRRTGDDARLQSLVSTALSAARRGASLTQRMLAFARRQELNPVTVDALALVLGMRELLRQSLGPSVRLQLPTGQAPLHVQVDESQLELALLNLAVNARDAMPDGGSLTISVQPSVIKPLPGAASQPLPAGAYVCISLRDTGQGMDEATLARATEPFFTTKGPGKGTGLGLSMIEGLALQLGGRFVLRSQPGVGTTAELWLPAASAASALPKAGAEQVTPTGQGLQILVVDDDELVLSSTLAMLEELGHRALGAASASEALQLLRSEPGVQLLLTDHAMPQVTGAELIAIARREFPALPAILASGFAELAIGQSPVTAQRLVKPFGLETLETAIARAMMPNPHP